MASTGPGPAAAPKTHEEIEAQVRELQQVKKPVSQPETTENGEGVPLDANLGSFMDEDIYGSVKNKFEGYVTSIAANDEADADDDDYEPSTLMNNKRATYTAPTNFITEMATKDKDYDPFNEHRVPRIADREDEYRAQRRKMMISPERADPFADEQYQSLKILLGRFSQ